jgi:hypothetical protein
MGEGTRRKVKKEKVFEKRRNGKRACMRGSIGREGGIPGHFILYPHLSIFLIEWFAQY